VKAFVDLVPFDVAIAFPTGRAAKVAASKTLNEARNFMCIPLKKLRENEFPSLLLKFWRTYNKYCASTGIRK
jgi:hypothetical protein